MRAVEARAALEPAQPDRRTWLGLGLGSGLGLGRGLGLGLGLGLGKGLGLGLGFDTRELRASSADSQAERRLQPRQVGHDSDARLEDRAV